MLNCVFVCICEQGCVNNGLQFSSGSHEMGKSAHLLKIVCVCVSARCVGISLAEFVSVMLVSPVVFCLSHTSGVHMATKMFKVQAQFSICSAVT